MFKIEFEIRCIFDTTNQLLSNRFIYTNRTLIFVKWEAKDQNTIIPTH